MAVVSSCDIGERELWIMELRIFSASLRAQLPSIKFEWISG
jgi:hypothetical protein